MKSEIAELVRSQIDALENNLDVTYDAVTEMIVALGGKQLVSPDTNAIAATYYIMLLTLRQMDDEVKP